MWIWMRPLAAFQYVTRLCAYKIEYFNPFIPNAPFFFYPLKTSESLTVSWCFQEVEKGYVENEWNQFSVAL